MSSLVVDGMRIAPELVEKLFEHYPHLKSQLGELVHVTCELEHLVERANAIFGDSTLKVPEAIERTKGAALNASIPVEVQPQPVEAEPVEAASVNPNPPQPVQNNEETPGSAGEERPKMPGIPSVVAEQNLGTLIALGKIMSRHWAKTVNKQSC